MGANGAVVIGGCPAACFHAFQPGSSIGPVRESARPNGKGMVSCLLGYRALNTLLLLLAPASRLPSLCPNLPPPPSLCMRASRTLSAEHVSCPRRLSDTSKVSGSAAEGLSVAPNAPISKFCAITFTTGDLVSLCPA